ncbi:hypothetical protein [Streptomyces sp. SM13]|uniref:hypothetical protein n=1 Tax=Streptomyces sp. SM13 TaxID=1983803 RepID=UPI0015E17A9B|nr:hypothetical protein [Streptomyces sp. SM13]
MRTRRRAFVRVPLQRGGEVRPLPEHPLQAQGVLEGLDRAGGVCGLVTPAASPASSSGERATRGACTSATGWQTAARRPPRATISAHAAGKCSSASSCTCGPGSAPSGGRP